MKSPLISLLILAILLAKSLFENEVLVAYTSRLESSGVSDLTQLLSIVSLYMSIGSEGNCISHTYNETPSYLTKQIN